MTWWDNLLKLVGIREKGSADQEKSQRELILERLEKIHSRVHDKLDQDNDDRISGAEFALALEELGDRLDHRIDRRLHSIKQKFDTKIFKTRVEKDGELFGPGKWQTLDPKWAGALEAMLDHLDKKAPFNNHPAVIEVPDQLTLAICGDWGTGPWKPEAPSTKVARQITRLQCDYTIHLGDVYYAGTQHQEESHLVDCWPYGERGSFTLNSNHEMYSGAVPYFAALSRAFQLQKGCSYFALHNQHWLIIGLDTAYHADPVNLYLKGQLNQGQITWMQSLPKDQRKIIVLSHHEGYELEGEQQGDVYAQVVAGLGRAPDYWYWGHLHNAVVYQAREAFHGRCVGHGAIPYGDARILIGNQQVLWYENQLAGDTEIPERVKNGFMAVQLNGAEIAEQMIDEDGQVRWKSP